MWATIGSPHYKPQGLGGAEEEQWMWTGGILAAFHAKQGALVCSDYNSSGAGRMRQGPSSRLLRRRKGSKVGELGLRIELDPTQRQFPHGASVTPPQLGAQAGMEREQGWAPSHLGPTPVLTHPSPRETRASFIVPLAQPPFSPLQVFADHPHCLNCLPFGCLTLPYPSWPRCSMTCSRKPSQQSP